MLLFKMKTPNYRHFTNVFHVFNISDMDSSKIYRLFSSCIPVKGFQRSVVVDLIRNQIFYIPNVFYRMLSKNRTKTIEDIINSFGESNRNAIISFFEYLEQKELVFPLEKKEQILFPKLSLQWDFPSDCSNAILDISQFSNYNISEAIVRLDDISCFHLQIRLLHEISQAYLEKLLELTNDTSIRTVQLMMNYRQAIDEQLHTLFEKYWKLVKVEMFGAPENRSTSLKENMAIIIYYADKVLLPEKCGVVSTDFFCINMEHFTESQCHNTCLNRKICIDAEGNIKNCPAMAKSYGNIRDTSLKEAIEKPGFKDLWYICKDQIDVCKDCEFRYMCTDCRCFIKDPDNIHSQPAKCPYNPYICLWEGQEGYVPVEECGTYSRETGFVPDKKRIKELNRKIWGEE